MTDPAIIGMFFDEMDRRIRSMQARGIQPCDPSADVYTPAGPKAVEYAREILADRDRLAEELATRDAMMTDMADTNAKLRAELSAARDALRTYGGHFDDCAGTAGCLDPRCDCGYANAIRAVDRADPSAGSAHG